MSELRFSVLKRFFSHIPFYQRGFLTKTDRVIHLSELILWLPIAFR